MMKPTALYGAAALVIVFASGCRQALNSQSAASSSSATASTSEPTAAAKPADRAAAPADGAATPADGAATPAYGPEVQLADGLKYVDLKVGDGDIAEAGLNATVHYTGWLTDGTKFDSSLDRNQPFQFRIGGGSVIRGWEEGVKGMRIGGKRHLTIPPGMGYGANGYPPVIPANATLVFDVELLGLAK